MFQCVFGGNIVEVLKEDPRFSTLVEAVGKTELNEELQKGIIYERMSIPVRTGLMNKGRKGRDKMKKIQAALVICAFAICGFDYLRPRKQGKTENNEGKNTFSA